MDICAQNVFCCMLSLPLSLSLSPPSLSPSPPLSLPLPLTHTISYLGGLRLLQATCKKFYQYCAQHGLVKHTHSLSYTHMHISQNHLYTHCALCHCSIALGRRNFSLQYDTNIPRQVVSLYNVRESC